MEPQSRVLLEEAYLALLDAQNSMGSLADTNTGKSGIPFQCRSFARSF